MGLGSFKSAWQRQTLYFGHEHYKEYSVLILDNRGMGDSDKPIMRYSTKEMALDAVEVLEHVGFIDPNGPADSRSVHVIGLSMGGMVAQELACLIPGHVASLSLCCTAAAIENTSPTIWENIASRAALIIPKGVEESVRGTAGRIFSFDYLAKADDAQVPAKGTHLVGPPVRPADAPTTTSKADWYQMFDSNYQRFVAQEMNKRKDPRFSTKGFLLQLIACGWHHKSTAQLAALGDAVGRERILVIHGTADQMISVPHGRKLIESIKPAHSYIVEGMGHAPVAERCAWYNQTLADHFANGEKLSNRTSKD